MKQAKTFRSLMFMALVMTLVWPQSSQAIDWFGNSSQEQIKYYQGYNDAMARAVAVDALAVPTKTTVSTDSIDSSDDLQAQIDALEAKVNSLDATSDDWGVDLLTTSTVYVTNPMTANLDTSNYTIGNYDSSAPLYFDGDVVFRDSAEVSSYLRFDNAVAPTWINIDSSGPSGESVLYLETDAGSANRYALYSKGDQSSYAGYFNGPVQVDGNLALSGNLNIGPALPGKLTVMDEDNNGIALSAAANGYQAKAGFFQANDFGSYGVYSMTDPNYATSSWAGWFEGSVMIGDLSNPEINPQPGLVSLGVTGTGRDYGGAIMAQTAALGGKAGIFTANGDDSLAVYAKAGGGNSRAIHSMATDSSSWAGWFEGSVLVGNPVATSDAYDPNTVSLIVTAPNEPDQMVLSVAARGEHAMGGVFETAGNDSYSIYSRADGDNSTALFGSASGQNSYAGFFRGLVYMENGGLEINHGDLKVDSASGSNAILSTVMVSGGTAIRGVVQPGASGLAGAFVGDVSLDGDLKIYSGDVFFGPTENYKILELDDNLGGWGGLALSSTNDVIVAIDSNDDDPVSAFRVIGDDDPSLTAGGSHSAFVVEADGKVAIGKDDPSHSLDVYSEIDNAEITIRTNDNTHWGIYQDNSSGNLNFWHGENKVSFTDRGLASDSFCLRGQCVSSWKDLLKYIDPKPIVDPDVYPTEAVAE